METIEESTSQLERTRDDKSMTFAERLAERMGAAAKASNIFGAPVERDGVTVIPVAKAQWGFGGGEGKKDDEGGSGGGGGVMVKPVGFIQLANGQAEYRTIGSDLKLPLIILGSCLGLLLINRLTDRSR